MRKWRDEVGDRKDGVGGWRDEKDEGMGEGDVEEEEERKTEKGGRITYVESTHLLQMFCHKAYSQGLGSQTE